MDCHKCQYWDKEVEACDKPHTITDDLSCLLKMTLWVLADIREMLAEDVISEPDDNEGEEWKRGYNAP